MPGKNGQETFFELKEIYPSLNVIISSGYSVNDKYQQLLEHGVKGLVQKPFHSEVLLEKVNTIMEEQIVT